MVELDSTRTGWNSWTMLAVQENMRGGGHIKVLIYKSLYGGKLAPEEKQTVLDALRAYCNWDGIT